jgi:hypothetical protein
MRYSAPADVSSINLSTGPLTVEDGYVEVPDDASEGDLGGLAVNGFLPAPEAAPRRVVAPKAPATEPRAD